MSIRITVYSGHSAVDDRPPASTTNTVAEGLVSETLRRLGLEWKNADYMPTRQVVITLDPIDDEPGPNVRLLVRDAMTALENTGLS